MTHRAHCNANVTLNSIQSLMSRSSGYLQECRSDVFCTEEKEPHVAGSNFRHLIAQEYYNYLEVQQCHTHLGDTVEDALCHTLLNCRVRIRLGLLLCCGTGLICVASCGEPEQ